jgi:hypothetical protein
MMFWLAILLGAALAACSQQPGVAGDHPDISTEAFLGLRAEHSEIRVGEQTTVTVNMQNVPMYAYHLFSSEPELEFFALQADSLDGGRARMSWRGDEHTHVLRLHWPDAERGPHPTQDPTETCERPGGVVDLEMMCVDACCADDQGDVSGLMTIGSCTGPSVNYASIDECIFGVDRGAGSSVCCLEYEEDLVCCNPLDQLMTRDECILQPGGLGRPIAECTDYVSRLKDVEWAVRRFALLDADECVSSSGQYKAVGLLPEYCICCEEPNNARKLSISELCDGSDTALPAEACFAGACTPDKPPPYTVDTCRVACCELSDGSVVIEDHYRCTEEGSTDLGFQSDRCPLTSVCCHQGSDFEWVSGLQVGRCSSTATITGLEPGTVTFGIRQVTRTTSPVQFREFPSAGTTVSIKILEGDTPPVCEPPAFDISGRYNERYNCFDGQVCTEADVTFVIQIYQTETDDPDTFRFSNLEGSWSGDGRLCGVMHAISPRPRLFHSRHLRVVRVSAQEPRRRMEHPQLRHRSARVRKNRETREARIRQGAADGR